MTDAAPGSGRGRIEGDAVSVTLARRLAGARPWLDRLADRAQPVVHDLLRRRRRLRDLLDGTWLGAPLHPALTDVPIGSWTAAFALDAVAGVSGSRSVARAADGALAAGVAGALPAALTGVGDWRDLSGEERRIATLHGVLNTAGLTLAAGSLALRAAGRRGAGRVLSAAGLGCTGLAAHLGGELAFGLAVRVNHSTFVTPAAPAGSTAVLLDAELAEGEMREVDLGGVPVLLTRDRAGRPCAIANTCSHLGGPLAAGVRDGDVVTCPWHGSRFDVCDGRVVEGPAVYPQPVFEARIRAGSIELRPAPPAGAATGDGGDAVPENPGFAHDIRPLFRTKDVDAMKQAFDLSSYEDVRANAEDIRTRLADGSMPCDGPWPAAHVQAFRAWMDADYPR